jgi:ABC-type xylose transport system permease subunit
VIAAVVVGGTALRGGRGHILGSAVAALQRQSEDSADNRATDVEILDVSQMLLAAVKRGDATVSGHADE